MLGRNFKAIVVDLDEIVALTMEQHVRAWKTAFQEHLDQEKITKEIKKEFAEYIETNPNEGAFREFLDMKEINLPEGKPGSNEANTLNGLINKGKEVFLDLIDREGVNTFKDSILQIKKWNNRGIKVGVVSGEENAIDLLRLAGIYEVLDFIMDGNSFAESGYAKPSPEAFGYVCSQLQVKPEEAILIESTAEGIRAGRESNFGLIVGMARDNKPKRELLQKGADIVVGNMEELRTIGLKKSYNYEIR